MKTFMLEFEDMMLDNIDLLWTLTEIYHGTLQETYFLRRFWLGSQNLLDKNGGLFYCIYLQYSTYAVTL